MPRASGSLRTDTAAAYIAYLIIYTPVVRYDYSRQRNRESASAADEVRSIISNGPNPCH
jgi:hypothetical protein